MANRTVIVGVGAALLVIGLTGLGLVQTGVIFPGAPGGQLSQGVVNQAAPKQLESIPKLSEPPAQSAAVQKQVPVTPDIHGAHRRDAGPQTPRRSAVSPHAALSRLASPKHEFDLRQNHPVSKAGRNNSVGRRFAFSPTRPVVIRFTFNPARDRSFGVASVHLGDRVRVTVRQVGQVTRRVYFTFSRGLDSHQGRHP